MHTALPHVTKLRALVLSLFGRQQGQAMIMTVGFLFVGTALVTGALLLASSTSISSRLSFGNLLSQYAAIGGSEHIIYRLMYEEGYAENLTSGVPSQYTITISGRQVTVTVLKLANPPPPPDIPPVEKGREFHVSKGVTPTSADPYVPTTYTYTITITNRDSEPHELKSIRDRLPSEFSYVSGSSSGITSQEPILDGGALKWNLGPGFVNFQPLESRAQTFQAQASVSQGNYGNEAWVEPGTFKTSTDLTARVTVGSPPNQLWEGAHATIEKTVAPAYVAAETQVTLNYTITLTNTGTEALTLLQVKDLLPPGTLRYVAGTTSGLTTVNPSTTIRSTPYGDRQELYWSLNISFQPGETKSLSFQACGILAAGDYYNEAWGDFNKIGVELYTWPTAVVEAMGVFDTWSDDGSTTVTSRVWLGNDTIIRTSWAVTSQ